MHENKETIKKYIGDYCFNMEEVLGEGFSSKVYKGFHMLSKQVVAIKVVSKESCSSPIQKSLLSNEIKILLQIDHCNLLRVYEISQSANNTYIVSELCDGGNLQEQLNKEPLKTDQALKIFTQICSGLQALHQKNIIHRDIKPANILIKNGIYKLADFGFAVKENEYESIIKRYNVGTPMYMAPEIQLFNKYSEKSDIWALGIMLYEMLFHKSPNFKISQQSLMKDITSRCQVLESNYQSIVLAIFKGILQLEAEDRINIQQILNLLKFHDQGNKQNSPLIKLSQKSISTQVNSPLQSKTQTHNEMRKKYFQQYSTHNKPSSYDNNLLKNLLKPKLNFNEIQTTVFTITSDDEVQSKRVDTCYNLNSFRKSIEDDSEIQIEFIGQITQQCDTQQSLKSGELIEEDDESKLPVILKPTYKFCQYIEKLIQKNHKQENDNFIKFNFLLRKLLAIKAKVFYTFAPISLKQQLDQWMNQLKENYELLQHQINLNLDKTFQLFFNPNLDDQGKLLTMYLISIANQIPLKSKEIQTVVEILQENLKHQNDPFLFARKWIFQKQK